MQEWPADLRALLISLGYVSAVLGVGELLRRFAGRGGEFTRRFVHIFVGLWIIPTLFLFTRWYWAAALPAAAVVGNFVSQRLKLIRSIERVGKSDFGTVFFPLSFVICLAALPPRGSSARLSVGTPTACWARRSPSRARRR